MAISEGLLTDADSMERERRARESELTGVVREAVRSFLVSVLSYFLANGLVPLSVAWSLWETVVVDRVRTHSPSSSAVQSLSESTLPSLVVETLTWHAEEARGYGLSGSRLRDYLAASLGLTTPGEAPKRDGRVPVAPKGARPGRLLLPDGGHRDWVDVAEREAREAVTSDLAQETIELAKLLGFEGLMWCDMNDERVRDTHVVADGQTVRVGESFIVGGALMRFPCDRLGPIHEWAGCRCILKGVRKL